MTTTVLDDYLRDVYGVDPPWEQLVRLTDTAPDCDGAHHPGQPCDWWRSCTGMAHSISERGTR